MLLRWARCVLAYLLKLLYCLPTHTMLRTHRCITLLRCTGFTRMHCEIQCNVLTMRNARIHNMKRKKKLIMCIRHTHNNLCMHIENSKTSIRNATIIDFFLFKWNFYGWMQERERSICSERKNNSTNDAALNAEKTCFFATQCIWWFTIAKCTCIRLGFFFNSHIVFIPCFCAIYCNYYSIFFAKRHYKHCTIAVMHSIHFEHQARMMYSNLMCIRSM